MFSLRCLIFKVHLPTASSAAEIYCTIPLAACQLPDSGSPFLAARLIYYISSALVNTIFDFIFEIILLHILGKILVALYRTANIHYIKTGLHFSVSPAVIRYSPS